MFIVWDEGLTSIECCPFTSPQWDSILAAWYAFYMFISVIILYDDGKIAFFFIVVVFIVIIVVLSKAD